MPTSVCVRVISFVIPTVLLCLSLLQQHAAFRNKDPDLNKNVVQLIEGQGYAVENYTVQTDDGYLLAIFRMPYGRVHSGRHKSSKRPVALIMTSLAADPSLWVLNFPHQSLGFILADSGYDVWLACPRGCTYSQKNVNISTDTERFWDFSWEEIGTTDLPAIVDFVLKKTKQKKLFLICQSMGSTSSFVFLSLRPEYNDKINALLAMAPVANVSHATTVLGKMVPIRNYLFPILRNINHGNIFSNPSVNKLLSYICTPRVIRSTTCNMLMFLGDGEESPHQYNETRLPVYLSHYPGGGSAKQLYHYAQVAAAGQFVRFDYGRRQNLKRYGQEVPPQFPLEKITAPVALFWSLEDQMADPPDVAALRKRLKNVTEFYKVQFSPFTHFDYIIGINAYEAVYKKLMSVMDRYKKT